MFHFLEYPFSRGSTHIVSDSPYEAPDFDAGFMNDKRDMAPMVWGYIKSRETARRMDAYAGEVHAMHPFVSPDYLPAFIHYINVACSTLMTALLALLTWISRPQMLMQDPTTSLPIFSTVRLARKFALV